MNKNKKRNRIYYLLILLVAITVGYAALSTQLKINGNATITKNIWNVYWDPESVVVTQGSKGSTIPTVGNSEDGSTNTKVTWSVNFELPGDFYEFTVDAANAGTLDAMITQITPTVPQDLPAYISYSVTYDDGLTPALNHILPKGTKSGNTITPTTEKYKVRIEFKNTITPTQMNTIPDDGLDFDFGYEVKYGQADDNAIDRLAPPTIDSCPGCVFAYYGQNNRKHINDVLDDYTDDYTTLKDANDNQRIGFLGHVLDSNDRIVKAYACGIKDYGTQNETAFCIQGKNNLGYDAADEAKKLEIFNSNVNVLQPVFNNTCIINHDVGTGSYSAYCSDSDISVDEGWVNSSFYTDSVCWASYDLYGDAMFCN